MAPAMEVKKRGPSINSRASPIKRRKLSEINSDANSSANTSSTSPQKQLSCNNNTNTNIANDIQIAKVESINEELFKKSGTSDEDCFIIDNSQTQTINFVEKVAVCRVCLTEISSQMFPLTSFLDCENRKILISECLNVIMKKPISIAKCLPDTICIDCIQRVINAYLLVGQFEKNEEHLLKINSKNINTSEMTAIANTPKMDLVSNSPTNSSSPIEESPKTSEGSCEGNSINDNNTPRENTNSTLERPSKVLCQDCNVHMEISDIGKHIPFCKANHLAANLATGKCKVLVCRVCNTLVFFKNMKSHSQMCRSETPLNTLNERGSSTNTKDEGNEKKSINRVCYKGVIVPACLASKTSVSNERTNLPIIQPFKQAIQRVSAIPASVLKNTDPCNNKKLVKNPVKQIINTTTINGEGLTKTANVSTPFKPVSGGIGLHPLENEIRKQLTKQYMFTCNVCFTSFTTIDALTAHKAEVHPISKEIAKDVVNETFPLLRCTVCKKGFLNKTSLMNHMKSQHT